MTLATILFLGAALWSIPTSDSEISGRCTYMNEGRMEETISNRGITLPPGTIPVALNRCGDLRRRVLLEWGDGSLDRAYVVDCARSDHFAARENGHLVAEVDAATARKRGFYLIGPVPVRVIFPGPEGSSTSSSPNRNPATAY